MEMHVDILGRDELRHLFEREIYPSSDELLEFFLRSTGGGEGLDVCENVYDLNSFFVYRHCLGSAVFPSLLFIYLFYCSENRLSYYNFLNQFSIK